MSASVTCLKVAFVFMALFFSANPHRLTANQNSYPEEHAAWGGNGGWWGGGNYDFYDDYAWRNDDSNSAHGHSCRHYRSPCNQCGYHHANNGRYRYHDCYIPPVNEYDYNDSVPGAGLYLNLEPCQRCSHSE